MEFYLDPSVATLHLKQQVSNGLPSSEWPPCHHELHCLGLYEYFYLFNMFGAPSINVLPSIITCISYSFYTAWHFRWEISIKWLLMMHMELINRPSHCHQMCCHQLYCSALYKCFYLFNICL